MQAYVDREYLKSVAKDNEDVEGSLKEIKEAVGFVDKSVPYDEDRMLKALDNPAIKNVRVFRIDKDKEAKSRKNKRKAQKKARKSGRNK